jgi:hypothetical protein
MSMTSPEAVERLLQAIQPWWPVWMLLGDALSGHRWLRHRHSWISQQTFRDGLQGLSDLVGTLPAAALIATVTLWRVVFWPFYIHRNIRKPPS